MKRVLTAIAGGLMVAMCATAASAAGTGHPAQRHHGHRPGGNSVRGSARNAYPTPAGPGSSILRISARSGPSGQNPRGTVRAHGTTGAPMGDFAVSGPVTCLRVSGNKAAIKYRFSQASGSAAAFQGGGVEVFVEDNGRPHHGQPVDAATFDPPQAAGAFDAAAAQCDDPNTAAYNRVESGDYTVKHRARGGIRP
jgi:hypothetical protein